MATYMKVELALFFILLASVGMGFLFNSFPACVLTFCGIIALAALSSKSSEKTKSVIAFFVGVGILILIGVYGRV